MINYMFVISNIKQAENQRSESKWHINHTSIHKAAVKHVSQITKEVNIQ